MINCPSCDRTPVPMTATYSLAETNGRRRRYECHCGKVFHCVEVHEADWRRLLAANARLQMLEAASARA